MSILRIAAGICCAAHAFILIAIGLRYLRSKEFQSYHAVALGRDWNSLDPPLQALLLAFIRGLGATLIAIAISTVALLIFPFREGATWATYALPLPMD
jgi:TRAP-type C4-dicarboxylate transport system permease small subunit